MSKRHLNLQIIKINFINLKIKKYSYYNKQFYLYKKIELIKIPEKNTKQDILNLFQKLSKNEFIDFLDNNIMKVDNLYIL